LIHVLLDLGNGARLEPDAKAFQQYVLREADKALGRIGYGGSYAPDGDALVEMRKLSLNKTRERGITNAPPHYHGKGGLV